MANSRLQRHSLGARGGDVDLDRDRALVRRCQEGDGAAFAELYTQYHDRLHRFCVRRLVDRDEADEVAQEAFLRAWRALPSFSGDLRFYPWLTVIAKNLCTDALRRRARYGTMEDFDRQPANDATRPDPSSTAMSSEEAVMAAFDGALAAEALTRLSDRHRNVLALREEAGLSYQEIARAEGVEISTVETLLWRARQALKREYAQLAGVRVLGGIFIAGGAVRRFLERAARRASRVAMALSRVNGKGLAAAGVVTVALASVAATQSTSGVKTPAAPPASTASTPAVTPPGTASANNTPSTGAAIAPPPTSGATDSGSSGSSTSASGSRAGAASAGPAGSAATGIAQVASQLPPALAAQVPTILNQVGSNLSQTAAALNEATGGVTTPLPLPPVTIPPPVSKVTGSLGSGLGGL
jgi:RNA polymerase sigma-70 factor (ECF subfamily)